MLAICRPVTDTHAVVVCANPADARALLQHGKQGPAAWRFKAFSEVSAKCTVYLLVNKTVLQQPARSKTGAKVMRPDMH